MSDYVIRAATLQDVHLIHALDLKVFGALDGGYPKFFFDHMLHMFPDSFLVEQHVLGYCLGVPVKNDMWLYSLAVDPAHQRNHMGRLLVQSLVAHCANRYENIWLTVDQSNTSAIRFYETFSFKITGTRAHLEPTRLIMKRFVERYAG